MKRFIFATILFLTSSIASATNINVVIETSEGDIELELLTEDAPITTENFLRYVDEGWYSDTLFHRVIPRFMVQGGGFTVNNKSKANHGPIHNEAENGLKNERGTVAMARTSNPHSATTQFFINTVNNANLNHRHSGHPNSWGYAVFAKVVSGMEVADAISNVPTTRAALDGYPHADVPQEAVIIKSIYRVTKASEETTP